MLTENIIGVTYRCNARCHMCGTWKISTKKEEELQVEDIEKLPQMKFVNVTGGEPFLRDDIAELIKAINKKSQRIVVSTNGFFTERILKLARQFPNVGIRISLEGFPKINDQIRGIKDGFDHGLRTLIELKSLGLKDIGFGITASNENIDNILELYKLANALDVEFSTAVMHNSFFFHTGDNKIQDKERLEKVFQQLVNEYLRTKKIKNWYRAYFVYGMINYINGGKRLLPCEVGTAGFYLDPLGEIRPCSAMEASMGNLKQESFDKIWNSSKAQEVRQKVATCDKQCWMICNVSSVMKKNIWIPTNWIIKNKLALGADK